MAKRLRVSLAIEVVLRVVIDRLDRHQRSLSGLNSHAGAWSWESAPCLDQNPGLPPEWRRSLCWFPAAQPISLEHRLRPERAAMGEAQTARCLFPFDGILQAADGILNLAFDLVGLALRRQLGVTDCRCACRRGTFGGALAMASSAGIIFALLINRPGACCSQVHIGNGVRPASAGGLHGRINVARSKRPAWPDLIAMPATHVGNHSIARRPSEDLADMILKLGVNDPPG